MITRKLPFALIAAGVLGLMTPGAGLAQQGSTQAQRAENLRATTALRARLDATQARITQARSGRAITAARAGVLQRQVAQTRQSMTSLHRQQGFVSAAEFASYNRTLAAIDIELDRRGVARSYGNDMLVAPEHGFGNDALPSAEVTAFQRTDARLRYRNARIEHDRNGCAVYQGTARDGKVRREPLRLPSGRPICPRS